MSIIFLLALPVLMYFLLIRPQQRRLKDQRALLSAVEEGDEILTTGGVFGFVNAVEDDTIWLEIADGVEIRVAKGSVMKRIPAAEAAAAAGDTPAGAAPTELPAAPPDLAAPHTNGAGPVEGSAEETPNAGPETER